MCFLLPARLHSNGLYIFFSTNDNESRLFILSQLLIQTQSGIFSAVFHNATSNHLDVTRYLLFPFVVYSPFLLFSCLFVYIQNLRTQLWKVNIVCYIKHASNMILVSFTFSTYISFGGTSLPVFGYRHTCIFFQLSLFCNLNENDTTLYAMTSVHYIYRSSAYTRSIWLTKSAFLCCICFNRIQTSFSSAKG